MKIAIVLAALAALTSHAFAQGFDTFDKETERATKALKCPSPKITPAQVGLGRLYGCVVGKAQTVKFFINEEPGTGRVANVKVMWNDWHRDTGYGVHADAADARRFVDAAAQLYAPALRQLLQSAFSGQAGVTVNAPDKPLTFAYTFTRGPAINERLITITFRGSSAAPPSKDSDSDHRSSPKKTGDGKKIEWGKVFAAASAMQEKAIERCMAELRKAAHDPDSVRMEGSPSLDGGLIVLFPERPRWTIPISVRSTSGSRAAMCLTCAYKWEAATETLSFAAITIQDDNSCFSRQ